MAAKKAFTIIELSIVLIIIGLIVTAIITSKSLVDSFTLSKARIDTNSSAAYAIENLVFWLESASTESFSNTQPNDGETITIWNDLNPHTNSKNSATTSNPPNYNRKGINNLPTIEFNGTDDYFTIEKDIFDPSEKNFSIFIVSQIDRTSDRILLSQQDGSGNGRTILSYSIFDNTMRTGLGGSNISSTIPSFQPEIYNLNNSNGNLTIYHNGSLSGSGSTAIESADGKWVIGINKTLTAGHMRGHIAEIIIYDRDLSSAERQTIENYLSTKWSISIS